MRSRRFLARYGVPAAGLVILAAGVLVWVAARLQPRSFGWYAYAPLTTRTRYADYLPPGPWAGHEMLGLVIAAIGLAMLTAGLGYRFGVRAAGRRETDA